MKYGIGDKVRSSWGGDYTIVSFDADKRIYHVNNDDDHYMNMKCFREDDAEEVELIRRAHKLEVLLMGADMKFEIGDRIIGKPHAYSNPLLGTFVKYSEWKNTVNVRFDTVSYESPDQTSLVSLEDIEPATKLALLLLGLDNEV